jgi:hypothetical protein
MEFKEIQSEIVNLIQVAEYVCVRGGPNQPLHRDLQWSIVLKWLSTVATGGPFWTQQWTRRFQEKQESWYTLSFLEKILCHEVN